MSPRVTPRRHGAYNQLPGTLGPKPPGPFEQAIETAERENRLPPVAAAGPSGGWSIRGAARPYLRFLQGRAAERTTNTRKDSPILFEKADSYTAKSLARGARSAVMSVCGVAKLEATTRY